MGFLSPVWKYKVTLLRSIRNEEERHNTNYLSMSERQLRDSRESVRKMKEELRKLEDRDPSEMV